MTRGTYAIPCNMIRKAVWRDKAHRGSFSPVKNPSFATKEFADRLSKKQNPAAWSSDSPVQSARLFVGFNVGGTPTYSMDHLVNLVREYRIKQGHSPDSSFIYQKGIYTHSDGGPTVTEDGAQVVFLNLDENTTEKKFTEQMIDVAEYICSEMDQETVIIDMQKGGVSKQTIGVTAIETL